MTIVYHLMGTMILFVNILPSHVVSVRLLFLIFVFIFYLIYFKWQVKHFAVLYECNMQPNKAK